MFPSPVEAEEQDPESQPLLHEHTEKHKKEHLGHHSLVFRGDDVKDSMTYHCQDLSKWKSLCETVLTVWGRPTLWAVTFKLIALAIFTTIAVSLLLPNPDTLEVSEFHKISSFLRVFVGLLLGFFMSASVNRWWQCAEGWLLLCGVVRALQHQLNALGVPHDRIRRSLKYPIISAKVLHLQLHIAAKPLKEQEVAKKDLWDELSEDWMKSKSPEWNLDPNELSVLRTVGDPAGNLWLWHGSVIGRLAEDGFIPGMATPTYGRIMTLSQNGFDALRHIRAAVILQAPYIYVQLLSSLVHINNIVNAVAFGLTCGTATGVLLASWGLHPHGATTSNKPSEHNLQSLLISFTFSCFGPFVYQALLEVSVAIAQPFSSNDAVVPTFRLLQEFEQDLEDGFMMSRKVDELGLWQTPHFKKPEAS